MPAWSLHSNDSAGMPEDTGADIPCCILGPLQANSVFLFPDWARRSGGAGMRLGRVLLAPGVDPNKRREMFRVPIRRVSIIIMTQNGEAPFRRVPRLV